MIECRGRNGWFNLAAASVSVFDNGTAAIRISSKNPYRDMPPIYLSGPLQEVHDLLDDLQAQLIIGKRSGAPISKKLRSKALAMMTGF